MNAAQRAQKRWKREKAARVERPQLVRGVEHTFYMPTKESTEALARKLPGRAIKMFHRPSEAFDDYALPWRALVTATDKEILNPEMYFDQFQDIAEEQGGEYGGCA